MLIFAAASCRSRQARVEKSSAHSRAVPYEAPLLAAVVIVPGPIKAAEITDQNNMLRIRFFVDIYWL